MYFCCNLKSLKERQKRQEESSQWRTMSIKKLCKTYKHGWRGRKNRGRIWIQLVLRKDQKIRPTFCSNLEIKNKHITQEIDNFVQNLQGALEKEQKLKAEL
jgi:hypothetical protein